MLVKEYFINGLSSDTVKNSGYNNQHFQSNRQLVDRYFTVVRAIKQTNSRSTGGGNKNRDLLEIIPLTNGINFL